ncbi:efflux RND transporter permease subunit [Natronogracilivirga saccharolytica]|uniref:Efflux RND transporter permease subunit n=1 Tax=Natronogracilivirga saccharolytica TaxID=2812953 RepID=A0A8J7SCS7_9BACT|nr:efflux RND transporter permease subunit [Natronogracilivirga saccharolytica]MBP3193676.1 efflux RND transporter permease subunit [Natronogracilivirga saccharolytica]
MSLSAVSIRRPVLASVMSIVIVLFGILGYNSLGVREYPSVDPPIITVQTNYAGANSEVIEAQITEPLEEQLNGIAGIRTMTSVSREGRSTVTVEFDLDMDLEAAANDVRDRVSRAVRQLPPDVDNPIVSKADADASPIVFLNVQSDSHNLLDLSDIANVSFKERLQTIPGVSEVRIWGEKKYSMRLWLDPVKMSAYNISPVDVRDALDRENVELPSGRIEGFFSELTVRTLGRLETAEEFNRMIIKENDGTVVRLEDVGRAELGAENMRTILKRDGIPMVGVVLIPQPGANNIAITDEFYKRVEEIEADLPEGISTGIGFDTTEFIRDSIGEVQQTIIIAFLLVVMIIFLFLRDWRTTIIPVIVIPIAIIGSFFIMFVAGFSINVLTLLGLVLAIGLVVDDSIVVMENIYAKIEQGMEPTKAALKGVGEIFFAVISTTTALVAVFMPVIFLEGLTGRLFREFGVVMAGVVIISSFVALTLSPMLCSRILKQRKKKNILYRATEPFFSWLNRIYRDSLNTFMKVRWMAFVIMALAGAGMFLFWTLLPSELAPLEDRSRARVSVSGPEGVTFEYMDHHMDRMIRGVQDEFSEIDAIISVTSPGFGAASSVNSGFMNVILSDPSDRDRSQMEIADRMTEFLQDYTATRNFVSQDQTIGQRRGGLPVQYVLQAPNFERLEEMLPKFMDAASERSEFAVVDVDLKFNKPEVEMDIDRDRARQVGVSVRDISETVQLALTDQRLGFFIMDGKQYEVIGQLNRESRGSPEDLRNLYVRTSNNSQIQLDNLVSLSERSAPPQRFRFNRYVSATISAGMAPGYTLGDGIDAMDEVAGSVLDESFRTDLAGPSRDFVESADSLFFAFVLAIVLIYLVLSAQFESFRDPFIILFTVPLAVFGAFFTLWYFQETFNIFSQIGIIMLIGLVSKNAILIVEFANQRKAQGMELMDAITDAAAVRFRPILMTSLSTVLGVTPIALALGAGSESRIAMGLAIIGGLIFASILTLFVIPAIYSYLSSATTAADNRPEVASPESKQAEYVTGR